MLLFWNLGHAADALLSVSLAELTNLYYIQVFLKEQQT